MGVASKDHHQRETIEATASFETCVCACVCGLHSFKHVWVGVAVWLCVAVLGGTVRKLATLRRRDQSLVSANHRWSVHITIAWCVNARDARNVHVAISCPVGAGNRVSHAWLGSATLLTARWSSCNLAIGRLRLQARKNLPQLVVVATPG